MALQFPEFKTLNLPLAEAQATQVATAQFKLSDAIDEKARKKKLGEIAQSSNITDQNTGEIKFDQEGHIQRLRESGFTQEANKAEQSLQESRTRGLQNTQRILGMTAQLFQGVTDQKSYDLAVARSYKTKLAEPDSLPEKYDPAYVKRIVDNSLVLQKFGLEQDKFGETKRSNLAREGIARQKLTLKNRKALAANSGLSLRIFEGLRKRVADTLGGIYDIRTGKISFTNKDKRAEAASILAEAERTAAADPNITETGLQQHVNNAVNKTQADTIIDIQGQTGLEGGIPAADIKPGEKTATNAAGDKAVLRDGKWQKIAP